MNIYNSVMLFIYFTEYVNIIKVSSTNVNNDVVEKLLSNSLKRESSVAKEMTTESPLVVNATHPCAIYNSEKPDFSAPGRRISEEKCYDYIWHIHNRMMKAKAERACSEYKRKNKIRKYWKFIVGGRITLPYEFPHMGAIGWKTDRNTWLFLCGSSLISSKFVLTAAHCSSLSPSDSRVSDPLPQIVRFNKNIMMIGSIRPRDVNIDRIIIHPSYDAPKRYYDIALMELEVELIFTKFVQPACLWSKSNTSIFVAQATVTGWGVTEERSLAVSPELQAATVDIIDSQNCTNLLRSSCSRHWCGVEDHQICAGKMTGGVDTCQGDSGGPLQVKIPLPTTEQGSMHQIIGVTAFGVGCGRVNTPGVYTRVSTFIDWIEDNVWR